MAIYQIIVRFWSIEMLVKVEVLLSAWKQSAYVIVPAPKKDIEFSTAPSEIDREHWRNNSEWNAAFWLHTLLLP